MCWFRMDNKDGSSEVAFHKPLPGTMGFTGCWYVWTESSRVGQHQT